MASTAPDEYSPEQLNYFRICHVTTNVISDGLRQVFKQQWDARYRTSHGEWTNAAKNGADFYSLITTKERITKARELSIIRNGNILEWDCTCLFYSILFSSCFGKNKLDPKVKKSVNDLRLYRNSQFAHAPEGKVKDGDFQTSMETVINAFNDLNLDVDGLEKIKTQRSFPTEEEPETFCDLPPKPSHAATERKNEVDAIIKEMEKMQSLHPDEVTIIYVSGNPGCGKSETARQVGEKVINKISSGSSKTFVATFNAASVDALLSSCISFSRRLKVNEDHIQNIASSKTFAQPEDKIAQLLDLARSKIEVYSSWLMIVDNVVDLRNVSKFITQVVKKIAGKGQIFVTTQDSQSIPLASSKIHHAPLKDGMKPDDAVSTLCKISEQFEDYDVVLRVADALDFQPLALACAAFYVKLVNEHR